MSDTEDMLAYLKAIARDMQSIRSQMQSVLNTIAEAESEVSEKMRRFIMYMHDVHDIMNMYTEVGQPVPAHILREAERCDDRYRHLLEDANVEGGTFNKVKREMSTRSGNRWDHTPLLTSGVSNETGNGLDPVAAVSETGTDESENLTGSGI